MSTVDEYVEFGIRRARRKNRKTYIQALDIECDILSSFVNENSEKGTNIILDLFISVSIHM